MVGAILLFPAAAQAEPPGLVTYGNFPVSSPNGVAIDQSNSDVYVAGFYFSGINKFDASGKLLPPSPFSGGSGLYSGAAVNPTNGDLYVVDALAQAIQTYDPNSGEVLSSFEVPGSANVVEVATWVEIAADSAGNVYLPNAPNNEVQEYDSAGNPLQTFTGSGANALSGPTGVAIDSAGNVWVADTANNRIEEFDPTGTFIASIASEGVQSVALDAAGDVFAVVRNSADSCGSLRSPCFHLVEYSPAGSQLADVGAGMIGASEFEEFDGGIGMLAVNDSSGHVYVADAGNEKVWIFARPSAPVIARELAVEVTPSQAKLGALVNPGGIGTTYRFEYGTTESYGHTTPFPEGDAGAGFKSRTVWAAATDLQPGTTYHYRVVLENALAEGAQAVTGPDQTFTTPTAAQVSCPNSDFRSGFSAALPDCRAYEQVTLPAKHGTGPDPATELGGGFLQSNYAAADGNRLSYFSTDVLSGSSSPFRYYLATRTPGGWSSESEVPPASGYNGFECDLHDTAIQAYSADLSRGVLMYGGNQVAGEGFFGGGCSGPQSQLVPDEPQGAENLFLRDNLTRTYQLIDLTPAGVAPNNAELRGASPDLSHVVFAERAKLTPDAPNGLDLYEWSGGVLRFLTVLPDGTPVTGSLAANATARPEAHAISADGSRVFFTANGALYERENAEQPPSEECAAPAKACTVQVDEANSDAPEPSGGGQFQAASADGSRAFFTDEAKLTADSTAEAGKPDLYEYDLEKPAGQRLTDLTANAAEPADVRGLSGASEDGSYLYFVASGVLTGAAENEHHEKALAGETNLYLSRGGATTFLATIAAGGGGPDSCVFGPSEPCRRLPPSGRLFAFTSAKSLTGYDNTDANTGQRDPEIFLYDAASGSLLCASCDPSGAPPLDGAEMEFRQGGAPRYLSDNGRLFFSTRDALLPRDTNGLQDVYEFEPAGLGSCLDAPGCLYLISTGTGAEQAQSRPGDTSRKDRNEETGYIDSSASGDDVFLRQYQQLLPQDTIAGARTLVDSRVDGGFPAPSSPPPCTTADACRVAPQPQPSISSPPSSATFSGAGNVKPHRKHHRKKRHHRRHRRSHTRQARANRGGHK